MKEMDWNWEWLLLRKTYIKSSRRAGKTLGQNVFMMDSGCASANVCAVANRAEAASDESAELRRCIVAKCNEILQESALNLLPTNQPNRQPPQLLKLVYLWLTSGAKFVPPLRDTTTASTWYSSASCWPIVGGSPCERKR